MSNRKSIPGFPGLSLSGNRIVWRIKGPDKRWISDWSGFTAGQEVQAQRTRQKIIKAASASTEIFGNAGLETMAGYCELKFFPRRRETLQDWRSDETRITQHFFPFKTDSGLTLGKMKLRDVGTRHLIDAFLALRKKRKPNGKAYAPKTIWNTYGVVKALFRDAKIDALVFDDPCLLDERHLGPNVDADNEWRENAYYSREELELLIASPLIPVDRQVWYALLVLGALRIGEAAALRWRHWNTEAEPLSSLLIAKSHDKEHTKTKRPRRMPVHPVLAAMLGEWKMSAWAQMVGRHPQPDDLVVPTSAPAPGKGYRLPVGSMRTEKYVSDRIKDDLVRLGLRHRRSHDLRATFITWALADGAAPKPLEACTHTPKSAKAFDLYNRIPWSAKCEAVSKLRVERKAAPRGELVTLAAAGGERSHPWPPSTPSEERLVTRLSPSAANIGNHSGNHLEAAGIEPVKSTHNHSNSNQTDTHQRIASEEKPRSAARGVAVKHSRAQVVGDRVTSPAPALLAVARELLEEHRRSDRHATPCDLCDRAEKAIAAVEGAL